jgi:hypothetical protein
MLDRAEPIALAEPALAEPSNSKPTVASATDRDPLALTVALWTAIGIYIAILAFWAFRAGMQIRDDAFANSHSIRFQGDIANGMRWGGLVLRTAEQTANSQTQNNSTGPRTIARAAATGGTPGERPLSFWDLYHGVDQVYQDMVNTVPPDGDYGLDYPPLRLLSMTLWTRHVAQQVHNIPSWPGEWRLNYDDQGDPAALMNENIAHPVLMANAYSIAFSAVCAFFLVWIWVHRGGRPALAQPRTGWVLWLLPKRRLVAWKPVPLRKINGLALFAITAPAFLYAVIVAENPTPPPPPSITIVGTPKLAKAADGTITATITAAIDGQGNDAQWLVEWGNTAFYGHQTSAQSAGPDDVSVAINHLPANALVHYRLTATSDPGITHTEDQTLDTSGSHVIIPSHFTYGAVWLSWTHWAGIALIFLLMSGAMRYMPAIHRGWTSGLVAAIFIWLDPSIIVDAHIWPQWDAWVLPPFFLAALFATLDFWFFAGLVMGVGIMFKGQTMVGGTILLLWPLVAGNWGALARVISGFALAAGLVLSPWLVLNNGPVQWSVGPLRWIPSVIAAAVIAGALSFYRRPVLKRASAIWDELKDEWHGRKTENAQRPQTSLLDLVIFCASLLLGIVCVTVLILRRWPSDGELPRVAGLFLLLFVLIPPWFLPRRAMAVWLCAILACTIWMSAYLYHGDWTWKTVGFEYGARKHSDMALGQGGMGNLPQILQTRFGWDIGDEAMTFHPPDIAGAFHLGRRGPGGQIIGPLHDLGLDGSAVTLDIRQFLMIIYASLALLAGAGAAIQSRRNDPRLLASFAAVWTLMPNILCQMAARYQMWGAIVSSMLIAISPGLGLLHIVVTILAAGMVAAQLLNQDPSRSPLIRDIMSRFHPDDGWIMLTIGLIFLYIAVAPGRRPNRQELLEP